MLKASLVQHLTVQPVSAHNVGALHPALKPFQGPLLCSLPQFQGRHASTMLWGTYRPGLYLGLLSHASCLSPCTRTAHRWHLLRYHVHLVDPWHELLYLSMQR